MYFVRGTVVPLEGIRMRLMRCTKFSPLVAGVALVALWPSNACAHLVTSGLGPVYDGLLHLVLTPEDLLPTIAIALLAGLRGREHSRMTLAALPLAWLIGGIIGLAVQWPISPELSLISLLILGGLVAADVSISRNLLTLLVLVLGLFHGYLNGVAMAEAQLGMMGLMGVLCAVTVIFTLATAYVVTLRTVWARIVVRVAGSWIAAIGLLMLGWSFRSVG
jgi:hydrogenase/urease accessory protein HupE